MANLTLDQIRSSQAFKMLAPDMQEQVVNVYDQSKGLDTDPTSLSTKDLETFMAKYTPGQEAAQAASFLMGHVNAGLQIQTPDTLAPTTSALADEVKLLGSKWGQLFELPLDGALAGMKTWKDLLVWAEEKLAPDGQKEAQALQRRFSSMMNTPINQEDLATLADQD